MGLDNMHKNGAYIIDSFLVHNFKSKQVQFPDSCPYDSCGNFPRKINKIDLKSYGYTAGYYAMQQILDDEDWYNKIADTTFVKTPREAKYVRDVRKLFYQKPWQP
jgi:hypothetical protein